MKQFLFIIFLITMSFSYAQRGTISVVKKQPEIIDTIIPPKKSREYTLHYFEASTSLGWKSPEKITGFNLKYGRQFAISNSFDLRLGIDYENYIKSNDYYKGSSLGYFLKTKLLKINTFRYFWIPISFAHKFGLDNKLNLGVKNYNEFLFGTGIGITLRDGLEVELNLDFRKPKAFSKRNTYVTPSIRFTFILFHYN